MPTNTMNDALAAKSVPTITVRGRRSAGATSRRALPGSAFGQPNTDRRVRLVCLSSGPDPKADGLLERPGEAFCPAKFIKLRLEGLAYGPDLALGAIAPVIDACRTRHPPRNPFRPPPRSALSKARGTTRARFPDAPEPI